MSNAGSQSDSLRLHLLIARLCRLCHDFTTDIAQTVDDAFWREIPTGGIELWPPHAMTAHLQVSGHWRLECTMCMCRFVHTTSRARAPPGTYEPLLFDAQC